MGLIDELEAIKIRMAEMEKAWSYQADDLFVSDGSEQGSHLSGRRLSESTDDLARRDSRGSDNREKSRSILDIVERKVDAGALEFHDAFQALRRYVQLVLEGPRESARYLNAKERSECNETSVMVRPSMDEHIERIFEETGISDNCVAFDLFESIEAFVAEGGNFRAPDQWISPNDSVRVPVKRNKRKL